MVTILTTREVAERTGWSTQTITNWVKEGHLPILRKVGGGSRGGVFLFDAEVIDRLQTKEQATTPPWAANTAP